MAIEPSDHSDVYEPPMVEDLDTTLGPAATAPGATVVSVLLPPPEIIIP
jgi:hypothetical protein